MRISDWSSDVCSSDLFDSTHITFGVLTAGIGTDRWQVEASAFNGTEPNEERWGIDTPRLDSWAVRASWTPSPHWSAQISYAGIKEPEALHPGEDVGRLTASISYASSRLSVTGAYARKDLKPGPVLDAWLIEANWKAAERHTVFARAERRSEEHTSELQSLMRSPYAVFCLKQ